MARRVWGSGHFYAGPARSDCGETPARLSRGLHCGVPRSARPHARPSFVEPMSARVVETLPEGDDWSYEVKLDGYRALVINPGATVYQDEQRVYARNLEVPSGGGGAIAFVSLSPGVCQTPDSL